MKEFTELNQKYVDHYDRLARLLREITSLDPAIEHDWIVNKANLIDKVRHILRRIQRFIEALWYIHGLMDKWAHGPDCEPCKWDVAYWKMEQVGDLRDKTVELEQRCSDVLYEPENTPEHLEGIGLDIFTDAENKNNPEARSITTTDDDGDSNFDHFPFDFEKEAIAEFIDERAPVFRDCRELQARVVAINLGAPQNAVAKLGNVLDDIQELASHLVELVGYCEGTEVREVILPIWWDVDAWAKCHLQALRDDVAKLERRC